MNAQQLVETNRELVRAIEMLTDLFDAGGKFSERDEDKVVIALEAAELALEKAKTARAA